jgi:hypothetical protein
MHRMNTRAGAAVCRASRTCAGLAPGSARRLTACVLAAGAIAALAGCAKSSAAGVTLPRKPQRSPATSATPEYPSAKQLVVAAYEGYWQATGEALDSLSPSRASRILAGYVPRSAIPALVRGLRALWRQDEIGYGRPVFHISSVMFTGHRTAAVHDCLDLSHAGFQDRLTGQVVGGLGRSHDFLITTLVREHGRWLVTGAIPVVRACAY